MGRQSQSALSFVDCIVNAQPKFYLKKISHSRGGGADGLGGGFGNFGESDADGCEDRSTDGEEAGLSPAQLAGMVKMVSALNNRKEDDRTRLLLALRPHLSPEKRERIDKAVKFLKIMDILPLIRGSGIL